MFRLTNHKLIRLNRDGSWGGIFMSNSEELSFGSTSLFDVHIKEIEPNKYVSCSISIDAHGQVSKRTKNSIYTIQLFVLNVFNVF